MFQLLKKRWTLCFKFVPPCWVSAPWVSVLWKILVHSGGWAGFTWIFQNPFCNCFVICSCYAKVKAELTCLCWSDSPVSASQITWTLAVWYSTLLKIFYDQSGNTLQYLVVMASVASTMTCTYRTGNASAVGFLYCWVPDYEGLGAWSVTRAL